MFSASDIICSLLLEPSAAFYTLGPQTNLVFLVILYTFLFAQVNSVFQQACFVSYPGFAIPQIFIS